jgi:hypothetical protein
VSSSASGPGSAAPPATSKSIFIASDHLAARFIEEIDLDYAIGATAALMTFS